MRARASVAVVVVSSVLALAGCGSDPEPKVPDESPSSAASASPAPAEPTLPPAAVEDSKEGAIAFVEHYIELLNYASDTGDVEALQAASADSCEGCATYVDLYEATYANGGYIRDSGWTVKRSGAERHSGDLVVFIRVSAPDGLYRESSSEPERKGSGGTFDLVMIPEHSNHGWRLKSLERVANGEAP